MAPRKASQILADLPPEELAGEYVLADNPGKFYDRRITLYPEQAEGEGTAKAATIVGEIRVKGIGLDPSIQATLSLEQRAVLKKRMTETAAGQTADKKEHPSYDGSTVQVAGMLSHDYHNIRYPEGTADISLSFQTLHQAEGKDLLIRIGFHDPEMLTSAAHLDSMVSRFCELYGSQLDMLDARFKQEEQKRRAMTPQDMIDEDIKRTFSYAPGPQRLYDPAKKR
ncbi:MAG: hypothetical protein GXP63_03950 [DPANN group archaeon]|nr:hypothetical protein [DPANN group archaeon]